MTQATRRERQPTMLIIGYGNELRGDDAVGAQVARAVATWALPDVGALAVHQLTPELAALLARTDRVMFIDACHNGADADLHVQPIGPAPESLLGAHTGDPCALLTLTSSLYGRYPQAWLVTIPASDFAYGARLSTSSCRGMISTLRFLRDLIPAWRSAQCTRSA